MTKSEEETGMDDHSLVTQKDWDSLDDELKEQLLANVASAPKEHLSAYQGVATRAVISFLVVLGWLLTSKNAREIFANEIVPYCLSAVGLMFYCAIAVQILWSNKWRGDKAIEALCARPGNNVGVTKILNCYRIDDRQFWLTAALIILFTASTEIWLLHLYCSPQTQH